MYPNLTWIRQELKCNSWSHVRYKVLAAYIIGSEAKGTAKENSDLDIAVIIPKIKRSNIQITEFYHANFTDERQIPNWNGRIVDFQFFFSENDLNFPKIKILDKILYRKIGGKSKRIVLIGTDKYIPVTSWLDAKKKLYKIYPPYTKIFESSDMFKIKL